jgi:UDP-glucose 4-epimerase
MPYTPNASAGRAPAVPIEGGRFAVVGGASLVGAATVEALLAAGAAQVTVVDNFAFGSAANLAGLRGDPRLRLVEADILAPGTAAAALEGAEGVLHLAATMTIGMDRDPRSALRLNIEGLQNVIEASLARGVRKLVFASSNAAYGYGPGVAGDLAEDAPFHSAGAQPASILYGASKLIGEQLCRQAEAKQGLPHIVLRYSTVYGERQHHRAANALFIIETLEAVRRGERPRITGDGQDVKHFVYVRDLAEANVRALATPCSNLTLNAAGPETITTLELVRLVAELAGRPDLEPLLVPPQPGVVRLSAGGAFRFVTEAARQIGWQPRTGMREGLARLIAWYDAEAARR